MLVDARGLACPLPVVNTKKAIEELKGENTVTVLVDNEIAVQNLQKFAKQKNMTAVSSKKAEGEYEVTITVPGTAQQPERPGEQEETAEICCGDVRKNGMVVVISANVMGTGDEKLGKTLMKAFLFALTKQDVLPETILLYNGGAYLSCEGADSLEDLKLLEAEGVSIMTCGTCLDYYGLKESLRVGTVTNMYDIVETMEHARLLIKP